MICLQKIPPSGGQFWHRRKNSVDFDGVICEIDFTQDFVSSIEDVKNNSSYNAAAIYTSSVQVHASSENARHAKEEWAAIRIQTAFRAFLVRIVEHQI